MCYHISQKIRFEGRRPPSTALAQAVEKAGRKTRPGIGPALPVPCAKNPWLWYGLSGQVFRLRHQTGRPAFPAQRASGTLGRPSAITATGSPGIRTPVPMFGRGKRPAGTRSPNGPYHTPYRGFCQFPSTKATSSAGGRRRKSKSTAAGRSPWAKPWTGPSTSGFLSPSRWSSRWWSRASGTR